MVAVVSAMLAGVAGAQVHTPQIKPVTQVEVDRITREAIGCRVRWVHACMRIFSEGVVGKRPCLKGQKRTFLTIRAVKSLRARMAVVWWAHDLKTPKAGC